MRAHDAALVASTAPTFHPHLVTSALDARHDDLVRQAKARRREHPNEGGPMRRISRKRLALAGLALAAAAIALTAVVAQAGNTHEHPSATDALRAASAKYHDISVAEDAGYSLLHDAQHITCIDNQPVGGMGVHFVNGGVGDTQLDPFNPEALVYAPMRDRTLRLAALEYIVFADAWNAEHSFATVAVRPGVLPHPGPEPVRHPRLLRAARLDLEAQPGRAHTALEPARALLTSPGAWAGASLPPQSR